MRAERRLLRHCARLLSGCAFALAFALAPDALAQSADEQNFREFQEIVGDFSTPEKIQAWEAFLQKYPSSSYVPQVRRIVSELKGEVPATAASAPARYTDDPDLDFLNDPPAPSMTPTPQPTPEFRAPPPRRAPPTRTARAGGSRQEWGDAASRDSRPESFTQAGASRAPRPLPAGRRGGVGKYGHTEVAVFAGIAPDEAYVRNILVGMSATQRFGRTWGVSVEGYGASSSETPLLGSLRDIDAEPEVLAKYNFMAGAAAEANLLSAIDAVTGQIPGRNDLYVRGGGGVLNADLEICKQEGSQRCAEPLFVSGVNFGYLTAGIGHRFYFTHWFAMRSEVRGRLVLELIDGNVTPRTNIQINLGPSFTF